jgi:hypothetical protein
MRQNTSIKFEKLPRMADFAECAEMISRCMGNADGLFLDAFYENIKLQTEEVLNTSLVASAILKFMNDRKEWNGDATELLEELDQIVGDKASKNKYWPKAPSVLSRRINEVKTNLREVGILIKEGEQDANTRVKTVVIEKPSDIGKMPFEPFEPFDRRGESESESPNNDAGKGTPNDPNDMSGILHNPDGSVPQNMTNHDISNEIDNATTRSENNDDHESSNDMSGTNGILHKPPENSACSKVPNDKSTTNPKLPPYVYRLGHSDRFACALQYKRRQMGHDKTLSS